MSFEQAKAIIDTEGREVGYIQHFDHEPETILVDADLTVNVLKALLVFMEYKNKEDKDGT